MEDTKKFARPSTDSDDSLPSPKRSRRAIQKRVVSVPIQEGEGSRAKGVSECARPADTWAWRKYGQKPIKGSPYPRGYYRCSSSKGCPARKQVERSRVDPTTLVVTYTCEHNHAWPLPKKHVRAVKEEAEVEGEVVSDPDPISRSSPETAADPEPDPVEASSRFSDLIMMMPDDMWYCDLGSTSSTSPPSDTLLYGPIFVGSAELAICESAKIGDFKEESGEEEEDALFAGLGELPEFSTVFRRSYWERQMVVRTAVHQ